MQDEDAISGTHNFIGNEESPEKLRSKKILISRFSPSFNFKLQSISQCQTGAGTQAKPSDRKTGGKENLEESPRIFLEQQ